MLGIWQRQKPMEVPPATKMKQFKQQINSEILDYNTSYKINIYKSIFINKWLNKRGRDKNTGQNSYNLYRKFTIKEVEYRMYIVNFPKKTVWKKARRKETFQERNTTLILSMISHIGSMYSWYDILECTISMWSFSVKFITSV